MPTMLVKGLSREQIRELERLKVELGCKTWAELLGALAETTGRARVQSQRFEEMTASAEGFLSLEREVSERWRSEDSVLKEFRGARRHEP